MVTALRIALALGGLLLVYMGLGFLLDPVAAGADFGLAVEGAHAITSARADFTSFFLVAGGCFVWGAADRRSDPLVIGAALMLIALAMRLAALLSVGPFEGYLVPMVVEAVLGVLGLIGASVLPKPVEARETGPAPAR